MRNHSWVLRIVGRSRNLVRRSGYNQVTVEVDEGALGERELAGALGDRRLDGFESGSTGAWSTVVP